MLAIFKPDPAIPVTVTEPAEVRALYRTWQIRVLFATIIGYALFYFVRTNLPMAMTDMVKRLGVTKEQLGWVITLQGIMYGGAKFANGIFGDRANARMMMVVGLVGSAVMNICFGFSSSIYLLGAFWMFNGWFQGMGFPPCARLMTHWFSPSQLARKMSLWNMSHQIGGGLVVVLCGFLLTRYSWRSCFFVPAGIALAGAVYLWRSTPDTPPSVGLPEVEGTHGLSGAQTNEEYKHFLFKKVFKSKYVWLVSISNFFVYSIRYTMFSWGPMMLIKIKHVPVAHAGFVVAGFEWSGLLGGLFSGWLTDRFFAGRAMRVGVFFMMMAGVAVYLLWQTQTTHEWVYLLLFSGIGFFVYGPQCLVSIAAANLATKRAAATAVGLTSIFGYGSTLLSGAGVGLLLDKYNWDVVFQCLLVIAGLGVVLFIACWPAKAHGYED